ncbi:hypothetical protein Vadar_005272 [Vaccinium darrowii]|uniref:Uncharacterized protein n=1 Tax=Vaccinium darrowii TaxID=229202 RepID=A0ACB7XFL2_9ERIC|nr:hypothetical protein Vadar_005272 [Vaccinium darrowii]
MSYNNSSVSGLETELTRYLNQPIVEYDEEDESSDEEDESYDEEDESFNQLRGSLKPDTVEALICLKDWQLTDQRMQQAKQEAKLAEELANLKISRPAFIEDSDPKEDPIVEEFVDVLVSKIESYMTLPFFSGGARIFVVNNLAPIGCIPDKFNGSSCDDNLNEVAKAFNVRLESALNKFRKDCNFPCGQ